MSFWTSEAANLQGWSCCSSNLPWQSLDLESPTPHHSSSHFPWSQPHQASEEPFEAAQAFIKSVAAQAVVPWRKKPVQVRLHLDDEGNLPGNASYVVNSAVTLPLPTNTEYISNRLAFLLSDGEFDSISNLTTGSPGNQVLLTHRGGKENENVSKGPFIKDLLATWKNSLLSTTFQTSQ